MQMLSSKRQLKAPTSDLLKYQANLNGKQRFVQVPKYKQSNENPNRWQPDLTATTCVQACSI